MEATGRAKRRLRLPEPVGQRGHDRHRYPESALDRRSLDGLTAARPPLRLPRSALSAPDATLEVEAVVPLP